MPDRTHSWCGKCGRDIGERTPTPREGVCVECAGPVPRKVAGKGRRAPGVLLVQIGILVSGLKAILRESDPVKMKRIAEEAMEDANQPLMAVLDVSAEGSDD